MTKISRVLVLSAAALAVVALTPAAFANCATAQVWGQLDGACPTCSGYHYIIFPAGTATDSTTVVARYWQPGNFGGANNGSYDDSRFIAQAAGQFYLNGDNGATGVVGCPAVEQLLVIETLGTSTKSGQAFFAVSRVDKTPADATVFNYNRTGADIALQLIPRPNVTSSSSNGTLRNLTISLNGVSNAYTRAGASPSDAASSITAYNIVRRNATTAVDDSRGSPGWSLVQAVPVPAGGGSTSTPLTVDCASAPSQDILLGTQLQFSDGQVSNYISQSTTIKCAGALADPNGGFKIIDRKPTATTPHGTRK